MIKLFAKPLTAAITLAFAAHGAVAQDHQFEIHATGGGVFFDDDKRNLKDAAAYNLGVGAPLNKRWTLEGVYSGYSTDVKYTNIGVDARHLHLDALYHFAEGKTRPFIIFGAGDRDMEIANFSDNETLGNLGVGIKHAFTRNWELRADTRIEHSFDNEDNNVVANLGVAYLFGSSAKAEPAPKDSDGDTVVDSADQCPNTPAGVAVDANGCALDSDKDGVPDHLDQCPDTDPRFKVDENGCELTLKQEVSVEMNVNFATGSTELTPESDVDVTRLADFLKKYPATQAELEGHTDSQGASSFNKQLSQDRAESVRQAVLAKGGIDAARIKAVGYGEDNPIADNSTEQGRQANRRVVATLNALDESKVSK